MSESKEYRAANFFDTYAHDFNAIYGGSNGFYNRLVNRLFRQAMRLRYERTLIGCQPIVGKAVLDVGCGPGHYSVALAQAGAATVTGVDFAPGMIGIAKRNAESANVQDRCTFESGNFLTHALDRKFNYSIVMGVMDYMADPANVIRRVLDLTLERAFFSFPIDGGILAWQRKLRYKSRCELYMYTKTQLQQLLDGAASNRFTIEKIDRDFFVTVRMNKS